MSEQFRFIKNKSEVKEIRYPYEDTCPECKKTFIIDRPKNRELLKYHKIVCNAPIEDPLIKVKWKNQEKCRMIFESILKPYKFPSVRPDWLNSHETGKNLELDGYNEELGLAFEYDGEQHFKCKKWCYDNTAQFNDQISRDKWKDAKCKEMGVVLIRIPYTVKSYLFAEYIREQLEKAYDIA